MSSIVPEDPAVVQAAARPAEFVSGAERLLFVIDVPNSHLLWGMNPFGYHLTTLLLHAFNGVLFYVASLNLLRFATPAGLADRESAYWWSAGFAALFFAIHSLRVESVGWVTERRALLFFSLLC